jgi:hypothetical protein
MLRHGGREGPATEYKHHKTRRFEARKAHAGLTRCLFEYGEGTSTEWLGGSRLELTIALSVQMDPLLPGTWLPRLARGLGFPGTPARGVDDDSVSDVDRR